MAKLDNVIIRPLITEKISSLTEVGNVYGFKVALSSNKNQIKQMIEKMYDVKILSVKTSIMSGKLKRVGRSTKKTPKWKKAFVKLESGQKIELFKGV